MPQASESGYNSTTRHACHCGKTFARKEHLTRHQDTHKKPAYTCEVCQRHFSRKDLLRRHSALHEPSHTRVIVSCDTCRANKTKCSGGVQCSLCTRRGIICSLQNELHQSKVLSTSDTSTTKNISVSENNNKDDESMLSTDSRPENTLTEHPLRAEEKLPSNAIFPLNLTIVPSRSDITSIFQPSGYGMEAVYNIWVVEMSSLEGAIQGSDELQDCVTKYLETFVWNFHLRWPVLHAPTLNMDISTVCLPLSASVCVIGAWFRRSPVSTERSYALKVHDMLLQYLLHRLIDPQLMLDGQAWPLELFQAVLLTLIFSLYRTKRTALSRAMLLRSTFVTLLQELGAFDSEVLTNHLKAHFTGTWAPYSLTMREKFKRLLSLTYQFDVIFALAHKKPPMLHGRKVGVSLPSTSALWNAHPLDVFATRLLEEPPGRAEFLISRLTTCTDALASRQLLVEDIQLGLCGTLQAMWAFPHSLPCQIGGQPNNNFSKTPITEILNDWKSELDEIDRLANTDSITTDTAGYLFLAYRGEDNSVAALLKRIVSLIQDAMILYYYLRMYHYAGFGVSGLVGPTKPTENLHTEIWKTSRDGRETLVCALQILKIVESIGASEAFFSPLIWHALAMSANVTKVLVPCLVCECIYGEDHQAADTDLQRWSEIGGPLRVDGTSVCMCKLRLWSERYEKAGQKIIME